MKKYKVKGWSVFQNGEIEMNGNMVFNSKKLALEHKKRFFNLRSQKVLPVEVVYKI